MGTCLGCVNDIALNHFKPCVPNFGHVVIGENIQMFSHTSLKISEFSQMALAIHVTSTGFLSLVVLRLNNIELCH